MTSPGNLQNAAWLPICVFPGSFNNITFHRVHHFFINFSLITSTRRVTIPVSPPEGERILFFAAYFHLAATRSHHFSVCAFVHFQPGGKFKLENCGLTNWNVAEKSGHCALLVTEFLPEKKEPLKKCINRVKSNSVTVAREKSVNRGTD